MIVFLTLCFAALVFILIKTKALPDNALVRASPIGFAILLLVFLFIPMQRGAPTGSAIILRHSVQVVSNVSGQVANVPVTANTPLKKGSVLFRIDPTQYQARVDQLAAQMKLAELRLEQYAQLERRNAGSKFRVQEARTCTRSRLLSCDQLSRDAKNSLILHMKKK